MWHSDKQSVTLTPRKKRRARKKGSLDLVLIILTRADGWEDSSAVGEWKSKCDKSAELQGVETTGLACGGVCTGSCHLTGVRKLSKAKPLTSALAQGNNNSLE